MDRWQDADDDITPVQHHKGRVARMGIAGFVQAAVSAAEQSAAPDAPQQGIVIVDSKREQRAAAARSAMPPPPAAALLPSATGAPATAAPSLPRPATPAGSVAPPPGTVLLVHKAGTLIQQIPITQIMTVFGRLPCNDVVLDHPSSSRQHAALSFKPQQQQQQQHSVVPVLSDLGSAHGTFITSRRVTRGQPCPLAASDTFQFGASTRSYSIQLPQHAAVADSKQGKKRARVTFAGSDEDEPAAADAGSNASGKRHILEQLIGYSDSKSFTPRVGPQAVDASEQGKFAHMLEAKVIIVKPKSTMPQPDQCSDEVKPQQQQQQQQQLHEQQRGSTAGSASPASAEVPAEQQQQPDHSQNGGTLLQQQQQSNATGSSSSEVTAPAATTADPQQQKHNTSAAGVLRSWSGGASRTLLPPQLARKSSDVQPCYQQQQLKQQPKQSLSGIGSSLYDQLPQSARSGSNAGLGAMDT